MVLLGYYRIKKKKWRLGCGKILIQSAVGSNKANGNEI